MRRWTRRARFAALASAAAGTVLTGWYVAIVDLPSTADDLGTPAFLTGVALVVIVPGLVAEWRRPRDPVAWLAVVAGMSMALAYFRLLERPWAATVGAAVFLGLPLVVCHLLLALPDGLGRRARRRVVAACWVVPVVLAAGMMFTTGPRHTTEGLQAGGLRAASWVFTLWEDDAPTRWFRQGNPLHRVDSDTALRLLWGAWSVVVVAVGWATVVAVMRMRCRAVGAERRALRLRQIPAVAVAVALTTLPLSGHPERAQIDGGVPVGSVLLGRWYNDVVTIAPALAAAVLGGVLVWHEIVRPRLAREADGAIQLPAAGSPDLLARRLQRALGDPTARILFPGGEGRWVDGSGRPVDRAAGLGRGATIVTRDRTRVALVEHDESLLAQPDLLDVAVASVAFTLEGGRHAALARASTEDIQASARRLLRAAEDARGAVARQIDDGPARTLAALDQLLGMEPVRLDLVHAGLRTAVAQVRDIARGFAPTALEDGLRDALDDLAASVEHPVTVSTAPDIQLPRVVDVTILLAAREAMEQTTGPVTVSVSVAGDRHDGATGAAVLRVDGWAGPLDQLVDDRIRTLGGSVDSVEGHLTVVLPLAEE
jgi:signal transduction histidine kinase